MTEPPNDDQGFRAWSRLWAPLGKALDFSRLANATDAERHLGRIIQEETESRRESLRGLQPLVPKGVFNTPIDPVDTVDWGEYLLLPAVLAACARRAEVSEAEVLDFAMEKCGPMNWKALFQMRAICGPVLAGRQDEFSETQGLLGKLFADRQAEAARLKAKLAAEARHDKPGGSRDKRAAIRAAWASGKYSSRDMCAEQESAALGMSFATARRALRNTPTPR